MSINEQLTHLGVFGPGVGVLHLANRIHDELPQLKLTCYSDRLNSPYSSKEPAQICTLIDRAIDMLSSQGVCQILAGCNTSSLFLRGVMQERYSRGNVIPDTVNLLDLTATELKKQALGSKVLLLGSPLLSRARYYTEKLTNLSVIEEGLSEIASDVDRNIHNARQVDYRAMLNQIYKRHSEIDSVVIVCTHFEVISDLIEEEAQAVYGYRVPLHLQSSLVIKYLKNRDALYKGDRSLDKSPTPLNIVTNDTSKDYRSYIGEICPGALITET